MKILYNILLISHVSEDIVHSVFLAIMLITQLSIYDILTK
jgi:hypothetical protein